MATADEILETMSDEEEQSVLVIDNDLRTIRIPEDIRILGVESDANVRRLDFIMPRMYHDVDLSTFVIKINYSNANSEGDIYPVKDASVNGQYISFSWLVGRSALRYRGNVKFIVCLKEYDGDVIAKEFNTTPATLSVLEGLEPGKTIVYDYPDIIEGMLLRLDALEKGGSTGGGTNGADGGYYTPSVDASGNLTWTASKADMPAIPGANIKGPVGEDGKDGAAGPAGPAGADGYTPVRGTDYWTEADQQQIVSDVLAALPTWEGGSY